MQKTKVQELLTSRGLSLRVGSVGDGWHSILETFFNDMEACYAEPTDVLYIKEKFGELTIYLGENSTPEMHACVRRAVMASRSACEECGKPGVLTHTQTGWMKTFCKEHRSGPDASLLHTQMRRNQT